MRKRVVLGYTAYKELCSKVLTRDGYKCRVCKSRNNLSAHHVIFRSHQGSDVSSNMATVCIRCHDSIHRNDIVITGDADKGLVVAFVNKGVV